jgi:hypothetical protein
VGEGGEQGCELGPQGPGSSSPLGYLCVASPRSQEVSLAWLFQMQAVYLLFGWESEQVSFFQNKKDFTVYYYYFFKKPSI